ncbi:MAG: lytic transglycosylase domain-containing protein [Alphaproteobacteria bacterium]|nr:lytic transglycosylase domain-containing protein [Alphaproteobacteria bacterium]
MFRPRVYLSVAAVAAILAAALGVAGSLGLDGAQAEDARPAAVPAAQPQARPQPAPSPAARPLPKGLIRQGDVVMMEPIADDDDLRDGDEDLNIRPSRLKVLSDAEHALFAQAFDAADHGDWTAARNLAAQNTAASGYAATARRLLEWRYALDSNSGASFADIDAVIRDTEAKGAEAWPLASRLRARAEESLPGPADPAALTPAQIVAWFGTHAPVTGIGQVRLGEALVATGQGTRGARLIRQGWENGDFDSATELDIIQRDASHITPQADRARLENLLWRGQVTAARRVLSRVSGRPAEIAEARIALRRGIARATKELAKVRGSTDPSLLFDWSHALRMADRDSQAHAMLLRVEAAPMVKDHAARWWGECNAQARDALAAGDPKTALALTRHCGFTEGVHFAEQEFFAGFVALRFLKTPKAALAHFRKLDEGVGRPISKGRAQYWMGRAYEAMKDDARALVHYRAAAAYPETFYGQVALAHIEAEPTLHLTDSKVVAAPQAAVEADPLMNEIKVLADLGQPATLRTFVLRDAGAHPDPGHQKRLMMLLASWGYPELAVRLAKQASYDGVWMPNYSHPVIKLPAYQGPGDAPDSALVLGLIRQETEFNPYAISRAGAKGLMQMMPASAKLAAKQAGLPYRPAALLDDTDYNMQLGMTEYRGHLNRYGGSLVLAAASYNAGPGNTRKWLGRMGDPRDGGVDPIDWIEQIPFSETRNYVQRVLENTEVYRARLAGDKPVPLMILSDLYAPSQPRMALLTPPAGGMPSAARAN